MRGDRKPAPDFAHAQSGLRVLPGAPPRISRSLPLGAAEPAPGRREASIRVARPDGAIRATRASLAMTGVTAYWQSARVTVCSSGHSPGAGRRPESRTCAGHFSAVS